jgi:hypothetical protein
MRYAKNGRATFGVFDEALLDLITTQSAKRILTSMLAEHGIVSKGHGHAGTVQERLPIVRNGHRIDRPHVWAIDIAKLNKFIAKKPGRSSERE